MRSRLNIDIIGLLLCATYNLYPALPPADEAASLIDLFVVELGCPVQ
jgi:hypothetical protein